MSVTAPVAPSVAGPRAEAAGNRLPRPMNPIDSLMHAVNESMRSMNLPGFETQAIVTLADRVDVDRLRLAVARLSRRYPIVTARLVEGRQPFWRERSGAEAPLEEIDLSSADEAAVLAEAGRLLSAPHDLTAADPIRFYLLHLPDGRDVFLMQYNHLLMDNTAAVPVLRELDRLADAETADSAPPPEEARNAMAGYIDRFPLRRRLRAAWRLTHLRVRVLRFRPVILGREPEPGMPPQYRIITRTFETDRAKALLRRVVEVCRWPGMSMAILGSVFRALDRFAPRVEDRRTVAAGIGVDLGLRGADGPLFQNLVSVFPIAVGREEIGDRESLARSLNAQLRDRLGQELDLATVELSRLVRPFPNAFRRFADRLLRNNYSLWYAYFGSVDAAGERFCGAEIADLRYAGPAWAPVGITLLVNQFRGRICIQATHLPNVVPDRLADEFLDAVVSDLRAFAEGEEVSSDSPPLAISRVGRADGP